MAKKKADTPKQYDSGEQAGVNCKARGCGRPLYWQSHDRHGSTAVCRRCNKVEMLFRPTAQTSNRAPASDKPAAKPKGPKK